MYCERLNERAVCGGLGAHIRQPQFYRGLTE